MRRFLLLLVVASAISPCKAQIVASKVDDQQSALYRGRVARQYSRNFNGTPYWDNSGFGRGNIVFNGKYYENVLLNVDAVLGEVNVKFADNAVAVSPDRNQVPFFTKGERSWVNLNYLGVPDAREGFYEILYDGSESAVLKYVVKALHKDARDHRKSIGYDDPYYNPDILSYYESTTDYWLLSGEKLSRLNGKRSLLSHYKPRKKEIRDAIARSGLQTYGMAPELMYPSLMSVIEGPSDRGGRLAAAAMTWHESESSSIHIDVPSVGAQVLRAPVSESLPVEFFRDEKAAAIDFGDDGQSVRALYQNKVYQIGDPTKTPPSKARITGTVTDAATGEPLPGVAVWDDKTKTYSRTDDSGKYSISLPSGENALNFSEMTKQEVNLKVIIYGNGGLDVALNEKTTRLNSAYVSAESRMNHRTTKMGLERVNMKTLSKIPSAFGEGDIIKAVLTLPGVKTVGEASGGINVRGSSSDQNLILFNDATIYNPSHLFGIFSAFNPGLVESVDLYKSSIPAEYGGRVSSVLHVKSKEGSVDKVKGSLGIGALTSRAHVEIPLFNGKTSIVLGGRTTYSDWMLGQIKNSDYKNGSAGFSDANIGITHRADSANTIQLFGYWSADKFAFNQDTTFRYNNLNASLRWQHKFRSGMTMTASAGADRFGNQLEDYPNYSEAYKLETSIDQAFMRLKFEKPSTSHNVAFGLEGIAYSLQGGHMTPYDETSLVLDDMLETEHAFQPSVYASDVWSLNRKFSIDYGLRVSSFFSKDMAKPYIGPELRLSGKYSFTPNFSFKAGANSLRQYIHLVSNTTTISPMDTWKLCDADIKPVDGWQGAGGLYWTVFDGKVDLSVESYWKQMWNYLDYKSGATLVMNEHLAEDLVTTRGKAYGIEFMARKSIGKLNGWLSYTYSRTFLQEMGDRGLGAINRGNWYRASYDMPHDFKLVGNYAFTARYSISANLDYSTGRPVTVPTGYYYYGGGYRLAFSERNSYRIPDYFRLDLALNVDPGHYLKQLTHMSVTVGCYNVTGRKNVYSVFYTTNEGRDLKGYKVSVFASQIPYINLNILF